VKSLMLILSILAVAGYTDGCFRSVAFDWFILFRTCCKFNISSDSDF